MLVAIRNVPAQKIQLIRVLNLFSFGISCNNKQLRARDITIKTDQIPDSGSSSFRKLKTAGFAPPLCRQCFRPTHNYYLLSISVLLARFQAAYVLAIKSKYSSSSFLPPYPLPTVLCVSTNSIRSIHFTILYPN